MAQFVEFTPSARLFPFASKWFDSSVGRLHYVDEGAGRPLLLLHGNPDWCFLYRKIISRLKGKFRCIALDYPGFGLSVHPDDYGYSAREHARVAGELVDHLQLSDMIVMGQDWGGPIGTSIAVERPERVTGLVMGNTWAWPAEGWMFKSFAYVMRSRFMQRKILQDNFFVEVVMRRSLQVALSPEEFDHYRATTSGPEFRHGVAEFPKQLLDAHDWLSSIDRKISITIAELPLLLLFGRKDPALGTAKLEQQWKRRFRNHTSQPLPDAGHYIQEDAAEQIAQAVQLAFS